MALTLSALAIRETHRIGDGHIANYRRDLCARLCTLDGKPAQIAGATLPFAMVRFLDNGLGCEFAWPTVERVLASGGNFRT